MREIIDIDTNYMEEENSSQDVKGKKDNDKNDKGEKISKDEKSDQTQQDTEEDEFNPTLAAMESEIKPKILETVSKLTKDYSKLIKYQKEKLDCILNSSEFIKR